MTLISTDYEQICYFTETLGIMCDKTRQSDEKSLLADEAWQFRTAGSEGLTFFLIFTIGGTVHRPFRCRVLVVWTSSKTSHLC